MDQRDRQPIDSDQRLLAAYRDCQDSEALAQLVLRHRQMVMGVCYRLLGNRPDAEDAFQATFLVLIRRAHSIRDGRSLGPWLYRVAFRTAMRARTRRSRSHARHSEISADLLRSGHLQSDAPLVEILDEALNALPERDRAVIVLCDLEGHKHREAAAVLGVPVSTVSNRLLRAHRKLRQEFQRRGFAISIGAISGTLSQLAMPASVPPKLSQTGLTIVDQVFAVQVGMRTTALASSAQVAKPASSGLALRAGTATMLLASILVIGSMRGRPKAAKRQEADRTPKIADQVILTDGIRHAIQVNEPDALKSARSAPHVPAVWPAVQPDRQMHVRKRIHFVQVQ